METVKTCIGDLNKMIQNTLEATASFRHNELMLETEDHVYELLTIQAKQDLKIELNKAKKLLDGNGNRTTN